MSYAWLKNAVHEWILAKEQQTQPCHYCLSSAISLRHSASETESELVTWAQRWTKRSSKSLESKALALDTLDWPGISWYVVLSIDTIRVVKVLPIFGSCQLRQGKLKNDWEIPIIGLHYKELSWCQSTLVYSTTLSIYYNAMSIVHTFVCVYTYIYTW